MKKFERLISTAGALAALAAFPAMLGAVTIHECVANPQTATSSNRDFHKEAHNFFENVRSVSLDLSDHADTWKSFADEPELNLESHAIQLRQLKADVNELGENVCRLEMLRGDLAPAQQKTMDAVASDVRLMADNVGDAITFLKAERDDLWNPTYYLYADHVSSEADQVTHYAKRAVEGE
jgi:hypothetical protein